MNEKGFFVNDSSCLTAWVLSVCHLRPFTHRRQAVFFGRRRPLTCTALKTEAIQAQELFTITAIHLWMQHVSPIIGSHYDSRRKIKCVLQQIIWTCTVKIISQLSCWTNGSVFLWHYRVTLHTQLCTNLLALMSLRHWLRAKGCDAFMSLSDKEINIYSSLY